MKIYPVLDEMLKDICSKLLVLMIFYERFERVAKGELALLKTEIHKMF